MSDQLTRTLTTYAAVIRFIAETMGVDGWEGDCEYHPLSHGDASKGFLELILPLADSRGGLLRGASGNGPIFIFLYRRGTWTYLGEMHGATVEADTGSGTTEFVVYSHESATAGVERRYRLRGVGYECVSETDIVAE